MTEVIFPIYSNKKFRKLTVGREVKMIELKKRIKQLEDKKEVEK